MVGYIYAIISSLFFALYIIPRKLTKTQPIYFSVLMSTGFFVGSLVLYLLQPFLKFHEAINISLLWAYPAGIIWAVSFVAFVRSIDSIGISRSGQWKNLQGPVGIILGLFLLGESAHTNSVFAILAGVAVFLSAVFLTNTRSSDNTENSNSGILLGILSGLGFGVVSAINKYVTVNVGVYSQQVVWSFGILSTLLLYMLSQEKLRKNFTPIGRKDWTLSILSGFLYLGASFFMLQSYKLIPVSIGLTIIQLSILWVIAIGIFIFKEIDLKKYWFKILLGIIFALVGIGFLLLAQFK